MKKNDKLVVILGVIILVIASFGIYYWVEEEEAEKIVGVDALLEVKSKFSEKPTAITVSDNCAFYPLIATPLAVNYNTEGEQDIIPLFVENRDNPSTAVTRVKKQITFDEINDLIIDDSKTPKEASLDIAKKYWKNSDAVLLIEYSEEGYALGVVATPIASYLSIPVIVTDEVDQEIRDLLGNLGVGTSIVCGNLDGYGNILELNDIDQIIDITMEILSERFHMREVEYITITNPRDAFPPEVLNETKTTESGTLKAGAVLPQNLVNLVEGGDTIKIGPIPDDWKYALVKIDFRNLEDPEKVEMFGDSISFGKGITGYASTLASPPITDSNGNMEQDRFYFETVLYDCGGEEHEVTVTANVITVDQVDYECYITIEELENPYYPMMKQISSLAPYQTAYHKGIIFTKPGMEFAADDDKLLDGEPLPGNTQPYYNPLLMPVINEHIYDNIHKPLNELLAKIKDINISTEKGLEILRNEYDRDPLYIALMGDTIMLPQYYYRSPHSCPFEKPAVGVYGTNTPSDFIYGNIDPETYFQQPHIGPEAVDNDIYTYYPEVENIVGRVIGWDTQDVSALIARTVFYDDVIDDLGDWKDTAAVMSGAGLEFQKLPLSNLVHELKGKEDPMKFITGEQHFLGMRTKHHLEEGGFDVEWAERGQAMRKGWSKEALSEIKKDGLLNFLLFPKTAIQIVQGFDNIHSLFSLDWWLNKAFESESGIRGEEIQESSNIIHSNAHGIWFDYSYGDVMLYLLGIGPPIFWQLFARLFPILPMRTPMDPGPFSTRSVSNMEMGPSVMFMEACGTGKIDGLHPTNQISLAYVHAGANAFMSPTTFSAIGGYLEPRPKWPLFPEGVGFGILGYLKTALDAKKGIYPPVHFCGVIFEDSYSALIKDDIDIGLALRNARNDFLYTQANVTYLWTPPLESSNGIYSKPAYAMTSGDTKSTGAGGVGRVIVEKYAATFQLNLIGDPAFNPYQPCNEGK